MLLYCTYLLNDTKYSSLSNKTTALDILKKILENISLLIKDDASCLWQLCCIHQDPSYPSVGILFSVASFANKDFEQLFNIESFHFLSHLQQLATAFLEACQIVEQQHIQLAQLMLFVLRSTKRNKLDK